MPMSPDRQFSRDVKVLMHIAKKRGWNPYYFMLMCEAVQLHLQTLFAKLKEEKDQLDSAVEEVNKEVAAHLQDQVETFTPVEATPNDNL